MVTLSRALVRPEHDLALLAFIKCHLTSFTRWNLLRILTESPDYCWPVSEVAHQAHGSGEAARSTLEELVTEGLVQRHDGPAGPAYSLDGAEPTVRVLTRLLAEAGRSQELRQLIVTRILEHGGSGASSLRVSMPG